MGKKSGKPRRSLQAAGVMPTMFPEVTFINPLVKPSQVPVASQQAPVVGLQDFEPQVPPDPTNAASSIQAVPIDTKTATAIPPPGNVTP
jgi:hypothetical protein